MKNEGKIQRISLLAAMIVTAALLVSACGGGPGSGIKVDRVLKKGKMADLAEDPNNYDMFTYSEDHQPADKPSSYKYLLNPKWIKLKSPDTAKGHAFAAQLLIALQPNKKFKAFYFEFLSCDDQEASAAPDHSKKQLRPGNQDTSEQANQHRVILDTIPLNPEGDWAIVNKQLVLSDLATGAKQAIDAYNVVVNLSFINDFKVNSPGMKGQTVTFEQTFKTKKFSEIAGAEWHKKSLEDAIKELNCQPAEQNNSPTAAVNDTPLSN